MLHKIIQKIEVTGKDWNEIFNLDCISSIEKRNFKGEFVLIWIKDTYYHIPNADEDACSKTGHVGEILCKYDDDSWGFVDKE